MFYPLTRMKSLSTSLAFRSSTFLFEVKLQFYREVVFQQLLALRSLMALVNNFLSITTPSSEGPALKSKRSFHVAGFVSKYWPGAAFLPEMDRIPL